MDQGVAHADGAYFAYLLGSLTNNLSLEPKRFRRRHKGRSTVAFGVGAGGTFDWRPGGAKGERLANCKRSIRPNGRHNIGLDSESASRGGGEEGRTRVIIFQQVVFFGRRGWWGLGW